MRFVVLFAVILATLFVISRTQVNEHARLVTRNGEVVEGTIARDFFTGDFVAHTPAGERHVPQDQFGAMVYEGAAISMPVAWLGGLVILVAGLWAIFWPNKRQNGIEA